MFLISLSPADKLHASVGGAGKEASIQSTMREATCVGGGQAGGGEKRHEEVLGESRMIDERKMLGWMRE